GQTRDMGRALMVGGVFLLSRDPAALADWYRRHLSWELSVLPGEGYYTELYFREHDRPEQAQHLVFAIMPGDPGAGEGHIINYRVDDIEAVVASLHAEEWKRRRSPRKPTPRAKATLRGCAILRVTGSNCGNTSKR